MTASHAQDFRPWPAPVPADWRFARGIPGGLRWELRRNCSMSPRQVLAAFAVACAVSLVIAFVFWWLGAPLVLPFTGLELLGLGGLWLAYARHAGDRETLTLRGGALDVEQQDGPTVRHTSFRAAGVRVEPARDDGSLIELSGPGRRVHVGRWVRPELRGALARELRRALRGPAA